MADWTKQTKATDTGESGTGFMNSPGFMAQGFLSSPTGSLWTKQAKTSDTWTKQEKAS